MKKIILVFAFFLTLSFQVNAQWEIVQSGTNLGLTSIYFADSLNGYIVGEEGLILKTVNGGLSWFQQNSYTSFTFWSIFFIDSVHGWACGNKVISRTTNGGLSWQSTEFSGDYFLIFNDIFFVNENYGIAGGVKVNSYGYFSLATKTYNGGQSWEEILLPNFGNVEGVYFTSDSCGFIIGWGGILKTSDFGNNWAPIYTTWYRLYDLDFCNINFGVVVGEEGKLIKTTDGGENWQQVNTNLVSELNEVVLIDSNHIFAIELNKLVYSIDGGYNWSYYVGIDSFNLRNIYFSNKNNGWAVGDNGVILHTTNGGGVFLPIELTSFSASYSESSAHLNWSTATELNNNGFEIERSLDKRNWAMVGFVKGAGTTSEPQHYNFADNVSYFPSLVLYYRLRQIDFNGTSEYSNIVEVEISPSKFALEQNYPNPFNPSTKISWQTPVAGHQSIKVFDVLGNEVATLLNEYRNAGNYEVDFNASKLSSGVYFYQIKAGNFVNTKKMILMK